MKRLIPIIVLFFLWNIATAQILHPVKWSYAAKRLSATSAVVLLKADIDKGWHIYSSGQPDGGPVKTSFIFSGSPEYELNGQITEPKPVSRYEKSFNMNVSYFENSVIFQQTVTLHKKSPVIKGSLRYMVCNDRQCLPPENVSFSIPIK